MTVIKYDVSDVPESGGGEQPQPGMYKGKIVSVTHRKQKTDGSPANDLEVVVDVGSEYVRLWTYIGLEVGWKMREFTDALGLPPKGGLDPAKISKQQPEVNVKVSADTDLDGNYRGRVKNLFKPGKITESDEEDDATPATGEDYESWSVEDLVEEIETRGLDVPSGRKTVSKLAGILSDDDAATAEANEDDGNEDAAAAELPEGYEDIDEWSDDDLKEELSNLDLKLTGRFSAQKARDLILENVGEASSNGGEPLGEADDYDEWELKELLEEIETRTAQGAEIIIEGRKTKDKVITALREDDKSAF